MRGTAETLSGRQVIPALAETFQQLYLVPGEEGQRLYNEVVLKGAKPPSRDLSHFITSERDMCGFEWTPAGMVRIIILDERADFELFLQIMANCCAVRSIPDTQGASIISSVINRRKIDAFRERFHAEHPGADSTAWNAAFRRFREDKSNYTESVIILSTGPYSNVPAAELGLTGAAWLRDSMTIRRFHECTHFICRKLFPDQISVVWDEAVADTVGIYSAYGKPDTRMAERFFGITDGHYTGGRLENYLELPDPATLDRLAAGLHRLLAEFEKIVQEHSGIAPFDLAILLEQQQERLSGLLG
ncbi:MAG: hypothetical protein K5695_12605 [Oscillospiraceae bacterium]|nr:hypothetical protein [Oscillospiraceae bacterium]